VLRCSSQAYSILYYTGQCDSVWASFFANYLPWIAGVIVTHLQVYSYLINWTALVAGMWVQWVCPMFMWARATKEAHIFENNFKTSMQMLLAESESDDKVGSRGIRTDGVPSIENSSV